MLFNLSKLCDSSLTPTLMRIAENDPDLGVKKHAFYGLRLSGDRAAIGFLADALTRESDVTIRLHVVHSLANTHANEAVEPLIMALGDRRAIVRTAAASGLAKMGEKSAIGPIEAALHRTFAPWHRRFLKESLWDLR